MAGEAAGKRSRIGLSRSWPAGARRILWQKMRSYEPPCGRRSRMWKYSRRLSVFSPRAGKSSKAREVSLYPNIPSSLAGVCDVPRVAGKRTGLLLLSPAIRSCGTGSPAVGRNLSVSARGAGKCQLWCPADYLVAPASPWLYWRQPAYLQNMQRKQSDHPHKASAQRHHSGRSGGRKVRKSDQAGLFCLKTQRKTAYRHHRDRMCRRKALPGPQSSTALTAAYKAFRWLTICGQNCAWEPLRMPAKNQVKEV